MSMSDVDTTTEAQPLSLRPLPAAIQRVAVYETRLWLYVVGSTNDGHCCRILKFSRAFPMVVQGVPPALEVQEDGIEYSDSEIKQLLIMLDGGNKMSANKHKSHGLKQVASAFGIIGCINFLEGHYLVLITKRKPVASIGGHMIYKIEDTMILPISNLTNRPSNPNEAKYLKVFQNLDLSSNFYFSYSYDLTLSLQCQMRTHPGTIPPPCRKFIWNDHLLEGFEGSVHPKWVLHITHGFVGQYNVSVYGRPIYLTMIARRSKEFAGTRFLKRGANDEGHVANEVEVEQIVYDATSSLHANGRYTSYLQLRGSVPSFWSQDLAGMRPKPQITIDRATPFATPAGLHFAACLRRFGSPIICLNLVKKKERRKRESLLTEELLSSITYLNQFLPPEHHIRYEHKDMARINKSKTQNLIEILEKITDDSIRATGFFHSGPELHCIKLHPHPDYKEVGGYGYHDDYVGLDQTGVLRVNCVDCLDRTNTVQFMAGKCALGYQLYAMGLLSEPKVPFDCDIMRVLEEVYEDLGDTLAIQYGGSQLVHRIQTYRKVAPVATHGRDLYQTIHRYYRNAFTDADKQMAINVFLGVFQPEEGDLNIWDLSTDYYLHHTHARELPKTHHTLRHTKWWDNELLESLPLPLYRSHGDPESKSAASVVETKGLCPIDSFDEVYKPSELTDFDSLFGRNLARTADHDMNDASPFVVRAKPTKKLTRKAWRPAIVGSPNPPQSPEEEDSGSSSGDSDEEDNQVAPLPLQTPGNPIRRASTQASRSEQLPTTKEVYGFQLQEPSERDRVLYERYAGVHRTACVPPIETDTELNSDLVNHELSLWEPTYDYGRDSVFGITPPVVSEESKRLYEASVRVGARGPQPLPESSLRLYQNYAQEYNRLWQTQDS